jgi:transposase
LESEFECYVGIDWATRSHQVCLIAGSGAPQQREFAHTGDGLAQLSTWLQRHASKPELIAVAIEVPHGPVVETLVEHGLAVFSLNPKQLDRFRDRHTVAGAKDDRRDAFVLADALRTDLAKFKPVAVPDASLVELREVGRCYDDLLTDINRGINRLREQLQRFAPHLLALCRAADEPWFWDLVEIAADPAQARVLRRNRVQTILARHRKRSLSLEEVMAAVRTPPLITAPGTLQAILWRISTLVPQLRLLSGQAAACKVRLAELNNQQGRTSEILVSHKGVGVIIAATFLAEAGQALAENDLGRLRVLAGTAPVTKRSGRSCSVGMRRACNARLRQMVRQWAFTAARTDPYARDLYGRMRARGLPHERALRGLADRLLACLVATLRDNTLFDPCLRARWLPPHPASA